MPPRYYGGYRGPIGQADDPLAAAIQGLMGGVQTGMGMRRQRDMDRIAMEDRARQAELEDADRRIREAERTYRQGRDAQGDREREQARQDNYADKMRDLGVMPTPGGPTPFAMGPSKREREMTLEAGIREQLDRPDLVATAEALGIDVQQMPNAKLRAAIAMKQAEATSAAELREYEAKEQLDAKYRAGPDPSVVAARDSLVQQRTEAEDRKRQGDRRAFAEKYIEAAGGDATKAWKMMSQSEAESMGRLGLRPPDLLASAQRYKDRRNPPVRPSSGSMSDEIRSILTEEDAGTSGAAPPAAAGGARPATDDDIIQAVRAVGNDEAKVRQWLQARGISPDG